MSIRIPVLISESILFHVLLAHQGWHATHALPVLHMMLVGEKLKFLRNISNNRFLNIRKCLGGLHLSSQEAAPPVGSAEPKCQDIRNGIFALQEALLFERVPSSTEREFFEVEISNINVLEMPHHSDSAKTLYEEPLLS